MLRITIPSTEFWDEVKQEFVYTKAQTLQLEHLLFLFQMGIEME